MGQDNEKDKEPARATFVVKIQYQRNATWQGTVTWANRNETKAFRSALELIQLMDNALDAGEETSPIRVLKGVL